MAGTATEPGTDGDDDAYGGLLGAFPYAARTSDSLLMTLYVPVAALLAAVVALVFALGLIKVVAETTSGTGGVFTFSRAFFIFVGFLVVVPLIGPVLLVARQHRRRGSTVVYDRALALGGFAFVASLYVGLVASVPPALQEPSTGVVAPAVSTLYSLPAVAGVVPPTVVAVGIYLLHRRLR